MRYVLLMLMSTLLMANAHSQESDAEMVPFGISESCNATISSATILMNESKYDSAQYLISYELSQSDRPLNKYDLYYLHCYETEILYYHALFDQGLSSAFRGLQIATELKNDTLIGSAENLVGLILMNSKRYTEAIKHFRKAEAILPLHNNDFLSYRYHALANMGECYLAMDKPDSAIICSNESLKEATHKHKERGIASANWNLAQAALIRGELHKSIGIAHRTLTELLAQSPHIDLKQMMCKTLMVSYERLGMKDSMMYFMRRGIDLGANELNTELSRIEFLDAAISLCIRNNEVVLATQLFEELRSRSQQANTKQQHQRVRVLKEYYEKNQRLVSAKLKNEQQQEELSVRFRTNIILVSLIVALVLLMIVVYRSLKQHQHIQKMKFDQAQLQTQKRMEMEAFKTRLEAVTTERNRIASDLHDDVGASLSSIRIYCEAAIQQFQIKPAESFRLLERMNESTKGVLDRMSDIVWSINPNNDSGKDLIYRMKSFASNVLGSMDVLIAYQFGTEVSNLKLSALARKNIYLIFKESLNNAAKYSRANKVVLTMKVDGNYLLLIVSDNGIGMDGEKLTSGNGLRNLKTRSEDLGGQLAIHSTAASGTEISFKTMLSNVIEIDVHESIEST